MSTAKLLWRHPHLVSFRTLRRPRKLVTLLHRSEVGPLGSFCDACPAKTLTQAMPELLRQVNREQTVQVLMPMLNDPALHGGMIAFMRALKADSVVQMINAIPPQKLDVLLLLLSSVKAEAFQSFCETCPVDVLAESLPWLLEHVDEEAAQVLAPLLNDPGLHGAAIASLKALDPRLIVRIVKGVPPGKLEIVLRAPLSSWTTVVTAVHEDRIPAMLVPLTHQPHALRLMLARLEHPERCAAMVNYVEPEVLVWLLRGVPARRLAAIVDSFTPQDFLPQGSYMLFMRHLEGNEVLAKDRVAPFVQLIEPATVVQLVQEVKAENLLDVLGRLGAVAVARILDNTNISFIIRLWNGPLEKTVNFFASSLSELEKNPAAARSIKRMTDQLHVGLTFVDERLHFGRAARMNPRLHDKALGLSDPLGGLLVGAGTPASEDDSGRPVRVQRSLSF